MLVCPICHHRLKTQSDSLVCVICAKSYRRNCEGFFELIADEELRARESVTHDYAEDQSTTGARLWRDYFKPLLHQEPFKRILDVGCGIGKMVSMARAEGFEAYGIDLPALAPFWKEAGNDPQYFFCADAAQLPFPDDYFDVVWSLGVIEHIGTETGHCTLAGNFREARRAFAREILRVTKPQGRIIIACPNKSFPVDIQHGPSDEWTPASLTTRIRNRIFARTGLNVHPIAGDYHLVSYNELKELFCSEGKTRAFEPLPLKNYFAFGRFRSGFLQYLGGAAQFYVDHLPKFLRATPLNPYLLAQIRK